MTEFNYFEKVYPENRIVVRNGDAWLVVWQQAVAYYWSAMTCAGFDSDLKKAVDEARSSSEILFYVLNKVGVQNMVLVDKNDKVFDVIENQKLPDDKKKVPSSVALKAFKKGHAPYIIKLKVAENLPNPKFNAAAAYVASTNGWEDLTLNLTVKIPPKGEGADDVNHLGNLSDYVAFKGYFPFAHDYSAPYSHTFLNPGVLLGIYNLSMRTKKSCKSSGGNINEDMENTLKQWSDKGSVTGNLNFINDMQKVIFDTIQYQLVAAQTEGKPNAPIVGATGVDILTPGDRGGASGLNGDYAWLQFVPKMIAYNWNRINFGTLRDNSLLSNYTGLMNSLGYTIPDGLNIKIRYAKKSLVVTDVDSAIEKYSEISGELSELNSENFNNFSDKLKVYKGEVELKLEELKELKEYEEFKEYEESEIKMDFDNQVDKLVKSIESYGCSFNEDLKTRLTEDFVSDKDVFEWLEKLVHHIKIKKSLKNMNDYVSELEVIFPEAPKENAAMALANLMAKRASAPFTTG